MENTAPALRLRREQLQGKMLGQHVLECVDDSSPAEVIADLMELTSSLPSEAQGIVETWIDVCGNGSNQVGYWRFDAAEAFDRIIRDAEMRLGRVLDDPSTDDIIKLFDIAVLNLAYSTNNSESSRAFVESAISPSIKVGKAWFRWDSPVAIGLLCTLWGASLGNPHLWLPISALIAGIIEAYCAQWALSSRVGKWTKSSLALKPVVLIISLYAKLSVYLCAALALYWVLS